MNYSNPDLIDQSVRALFKRPRIVFLLDVSWHLHRNQNTFKNMTAGVGGRPTGHIYGFLNTIKLIRTNFPDSLIVFCKDGVPVRRQKIMESRENSYKADRPELEFNIYGDYSLIIASASLLGGVVEAYLPDQESDDLMSNLCRQIREVSPESFCYVYSGDDDLLQTIYEGHSCVVRKFDKGYPIKINNDYMLLDERMLEKYHRCDSYHLPFYRAVAGDKSDRISGVPRFNRDALFKIAMSSSKIEDMWQLPDWSKKDGTYKYRQILQNYKDLLQQNYQLMALRDEFRVVLKSYTPPRIPVIRKLSEYKMFSFITYLQQKGV